MGCQLLKQFLKIPSGVWVVAIGIPPVSQASGIRPPAPKPKGHTALQPASSPENQVVGPMDWNHFAGFLFGRSLDTEGELGRSGFKEQPSAGQLTTWLPKVAGLFGK